MGKDLANRARGFLGRMRSGARRYGLLAVLRDRKRVHAALERERPYRKWIARQRDPLQPWGDMKFSVPTVSFSLVVHSDAASLRDLRRTVETVQAQTFPFWELHLASGSLFRRELLRRRFRGMKRIEFAGLKRLRLRGTHIAYLTPGDLLDRNALYYLYRTISDHPDGHGAYTDQDRVDGRGRRYDPWFKPRWSPELLLSRNYVNRLCAVRLESAKRVGGADLRRGIASDYDLLLRLRAASMDLHSCPRVLCHTVDSRWRRALERGRERKERRILAKHLAGSSPPGRVRPGLAPQTRVARFSIIGKPIVSVIIPFKDKPELLERCAESIFRRTSYPYYELILVSTNSELPATRALAHRLSGRRRVRVLERNVPFSYSAVNNWAARRASGDYLLFLNNDTEVIAGDWLEAMLEYAQFPEIGAVGAKLLYPDGTVQHAGVVVGGRSLAGHAFSKQPAWLSYQRQASVVRNCLAVTAACLMVGVEKFWQAGGFDETFTLCGNDVALCIELLRRGYRTVYLPHVALYHHEQSTRGTALPPPGDFVASFRHYQPYLEHGDPYFSPNLSLRTKDGAPRVDEDNPYPELARRYASGPPAMPAPGKPAVPQQPLASPRPAPAPRARA